MIGDNIYYKWLSTEDSKLHYYKKLSTDDGKLSCNK